MPAIHYGASRIELQADESVLQALIRSGIDTPYSCESGCCQTCMLQAEDGELPAESQASLIGKLRSQGYFLPCVCHPQTDIYLRSEEADNIYQVTHLIEKTIYNSEVCRLRLARPTGFDYQAGQFINVRSPDQKQLIRSYSLSSLASEDDYLEIQVRLKRNGKLSSQLYNSATAGDKFEIQGANGNCFYQSESQQSLLLIATHTGIAPLFGLLRQAIAQGHLGQVFVYYGSREIEGLYLLPELQALAQQHSNVNITACLSNLEASLTDESTAVRRGRANDLAFAEHPQLQGYDLYLCGNAEMVKAAQMQGFMVGAGMDRIFTDPFEYKELRKTARE